MKKSIVLGSESAIDAEGSQDVYNRGLERSVPRYHIPHFVKLTWIYDLPVGRGKALNIPNKFVDMLFGGWTLTGIHNWRSGDALSISTSGFETNGIFNGTFRPDLVPGQPIFLDKNAKTDFAQTGARYLNPAAFSQIPRSSRGVPTRFGTAPPMLPNVRGPARFTDDLGIRKRFNFTEERSFEVRGDFFNVLNKGGRGNPVTNITNTNFGRITGPAYGPRNIQVEARVNF